MQVSSKSLRLQAVYDSSHENILSIIKQAIISTDKGLLLGLLVAGNKVISFNDLIWDDKLKTFYIKDKSSICGTNEIQRLDKALNKNEYFNKQVVKTKNGAKLGKLRDCLFDPVNGILLTIIAKETKWIKPKQLLIHKNNILDVDPSVIIVRDNQIMKTKVKQKKAAPKLRTALSEQN